MVEAGARVVARSQKLRRAFLVVALSIGWLSIALSFYLAVERSGIVAFFCSFTVLANVLAVLALTGAFSSAGRSPAPGVMGAIVVYVVVVVAMFLGVLYELWSAHGAEFVSSAALHFVVPALFVLYWLIFVAKGSLRWHVPFIWLIFPLAYLALSLVRGAMTGVYPYPFIDAGAIGYQKVVVNAVEILLTYLGIGLVVVGIDRLAGRIQA
jgi:hypothetical protein